VGKRIKHPRQMALIREPASEGYLDDRKRCSAQQLLGNSDPVLLKPTMRGHAGRLFKRLDEILPREPTLPRDIGKRYSSGEVANDQVLGAVQLKRREATAANADLRFYSVSLQEVHA
jgi:hypothetical protein